MITPSKASIALTAVFLTACVSRQQPVITSFEECVAAGNPVMESYPRQCRANGVTFVEEIDDARSSIHPESPEAGAIVTSPLTVTGEARGTWYFEASFPVRLLDADGNEIAVIPAQAQDEWMTENFVPYVATLTFDEPVTDTGTLVLEKDNPSGLPEHAAEVRIPVSFR